MVEGLQFIVDDTGQKTAAIINLKRWGELWEDFYDVLVSESRSNEQTISWQELKEELKYQKPEN